jgi:NADPH:quinone reductase-like Zn-dependent oxidoreductase
MILRLGQRFDLTVVHVVRRPAQVDLLHALGAGHVLDSSEPEFDARLQEQCHELNVRLALDAVAGKMTGRLLDAMPRHSKAIVYGGLSGQAVRVDPRRLIFADQRVDGFWLADWMGHKGMLDWLLTVYRVQKALAAELKTEVQERYPLREGVAAIRHYMDNMTEGKVLLLPGEARALERSRRPL